MGYDNLPKDMHTPSLLLRNKMYSLVAMTTMSDIELSQVEIKVVKREDHVHIENSLTNLVGSKETDTFSTKFIKSEDGEHDKWVSLQKQEILFGGEKCVMLSLRDVTSLHILNKTKQEKALL